MLFHQRFVPSLAIASYIVGDEKTGDAAVIDPTRDIADFINYARDNDLHIIETHVHADFVCGSGYRASIASSFLKRHGFEDVANVLGGMSAWKAAELPTA